MPTNVQDFHDDTAFERYVLARGTPLVMPPEGGIVFGLGDDGSNSPTVQAGVATTATPAGAPGDQLKRSDIAPLVFGAAWKVLDLLVELRLEQLGVSKNAQGRYTIQFKVDKVKTVSAPAPFDTEVPLWKQVLKCVSRDAVHWSTRNDGQFGDDAVLLEASFLLPVCDHRGVGVGCGAQPLQSRSK